MNFITKKHLSRRTVLRGVGAVVALPLLDAMIPAGTALAQTAAAPKMQHGVHLLSRMARSWSKWTPSRHGTDFELTPILEPLEPLPEAD